MTIQPTTLLAAAVTGFASASALAAPTVTVPLEATSNLFQPDQSVHFEVQLKGFDAGDATVAARVTDYFGQEVWSDTHPASVGEGGEAVVPVSIPDLDKGYYELHLDVTGAGGAAVAGMSSFGVAPFVDRSAAEAREEGYRFGLKKWNWSASQNGLEWDEAIAVEASAKLGLQWTREMLQEKRHLGTIEMIERYPMNVVLKIERFPRSMYDTERYGPMDAWEAEQGRGAWSLKTLPMKEPYQAWLRDEVAAIPEDQQVFEIWNEAWDKMTPEDFAEISKWIAEVVYDERPDAILGPNLLGSTSDFQFDARYIEAGGMDRMNMVALHPYGNAANREWLRDYRNWLHEKLGREVDIYVTEFGSHSTPEGPARRTEQEQAQRVVQQALYLYAEGVKAFMPHTMGQSERNPTYHEEWFGLFRFNHQPKPAVIAYATAARVIDSSRYVGDLWFGPGVDAMLFERDGRFTLALGTRGETVEVDVEPGVDEVTVVDMVGQETRQQAADGKLRVAVSGDWTYLVGVSPELEGQASTELRPDRWPRPETPERNHRELARMATPPTMDGQLDDWNGATQVAMLNPKVNGNDASGIAYLGWDEEHLYVGLNMRDNQVYNPNPLAKLYLGDSLELFVSVDPRDEGAGYAETDHQFFLTPTSNEGRPMFTEVVDSPDTSVQDEITQPASFIGPGGDGWVIEAAIPWSRLSGFEARAGATLALELRVNDADASHERFKIDPDDAQGVPPMNPSRWSLHTLVE